MTTTPVPPALVLKTSGLNRRFGGVHALRSLELSVRANTIHAIVGENGAGKSTLMNIIAGVLPPDSGIVELSGQPFAPANVAAARAMGIGIVHQELRLFPDRSVLANLFVGAPTTRRGLIDLPAMARQAAPVMERLGLNVDPFEIVRDLSLSDRQLVELTRVLLEEPRLLILDEPTSALNNTETQRLAEIIRTLPGNGTTVLYVSHRLKEVFDLADDITVMRDGTNVLADHTSNLTMAKVVKAIVGDEDFEAPARQQVGVEVGSFLVKGELRVDDLSSAGSLNGVSFDAAPGEIVGVAGLVGSGADEILGVLFGAIARSGGQAIYPDGKDIPRNPTEAARRGIALVPADRRHAGLMLDRTIFDNLALVRIGALNQGSFIMRKSRLRRSAIEVMARFGIKADDSDTLVSALSGGNQQKVVVAKWLITNPDLILLDDPTRGVDIGAKGEIFSLIRTLANDGRVVIFRSTELAELVLLCDKIIVLHDGTVSAVLRGVTESELLQAVNTSLVSEGVGT